LHHALDRDPIFRAVSSYYGVTTADGTPATLICNALLLSNDFITGKVILLDSGASALETRGATVFAPGTGTITVNPVFSSPVLAGTGFYILTQQSAAAALAAILAAIAALQADVGDASPASILGSLYGILGNPAVPLATSIAAILIAIGAGTGTSQGLFYYGLVTGAVAPSFTIATLAGLGNGKFADATAPYRAFVMRRAAAPGVAPQGEQQTITAYVSAGGVFTAGAFTAPGVAIGDEVLIIHPRLAEIAQILADTDPRVMGRSQITATTIDLNQPAATYDLFTATTQDVVVEKLVIRMSGGALAAPFTFLTIQTDDATPIVLIDAAAGAVANLTNEAQLAWTGAVLLDAATNAKIRLTIAVAFGGAARVCDVIAECRAVVAGGYLA
jgi:hypothetical protein